MWSIGVIAYEMAFGSTPFQAANHIHLLRVIENSDDSKFDFPINVKIKTTTTTTTSSSSSTKRSNTLGQLARASTAAKYSTVAINTSPSLRALISGLLKKDPKDRMEFSSFYNHSFFDDGHTECNRVTTVCSQSNSNSTASSTSSIDRAVTNALTLINGTTDASLEISALLGRIDSHDSKIVSVLKTSLAVVLVPDQVLCAEMQKFGAVHQSASSMASLSSSLLNTPATTTTTTTSLSASRILRQEQRQSQAKNTLVILHHSVNLLENCQQLVTSAYAAPEADKGSLLAVGKWVSCKMEEQHELLDELKYFARASAVTRSTLALAVSSSLPAPQGKSNLFASMAETAITSDIDAIIYENACNVGKDAGIQELLGNRKHAEAAYHTATLMLELILHPAQFVPLTSHLAQMAAPDDTTRTAIKQVQARMEARLAHCK